MRYGTLVEEIKNEFLRNKGSSTPAGTYPTTVAKMYDYLCNYKKDPKNLTRLLGQNPGGDSLSTGKAFMQDAGNKDDNTNAQEQIFITNGGSGNANNQKKVCRRCGTDGHTSVECDSGKDKVNIYQQLQQANQGVSQLIHAVNWDGVTNTINDNKATNWIFLNSVLFKSNGPTKCTKYNKNGTVAQTHKSTIFLQANSGIPNTWYLLDNQSTCNIISNPKLVKYIHAAGNPSWIDNHELDGQRSWLPPTCLVPPWRHGEHPVNGQHDRQVPCDL
jgi:hypothetical protein